MRVLLIEDEPTTAKSIELMLGTEGFNVYTTDLGEEGLDLGKLYDYDIILLDLNLPDMHGYDVLKKLRTAKVSTPVLILSGIGEMDCKVRALGFGADDYVTKPFHRDELVARIHAIVRRSKGHSQSVIRTGKLAVNLDAKTVEVDGARVHLTGKEYAMLELLSLRKGTTLTKEMFLNHLYGGMDEPELKIIDVFICKLRKKLASLAAAPITSRPSGAAATCCATPKRIEATAAGRRRLTIPCREGERRGRKAPPFTSQLKRRRGGGDGSRRGGDRERFAQRRASSSSVVHPPPAVAAEPFERTEAGLVGHAPGALDPIAKVDVGQSGARGADDVVEDDEGAETFPRVRPDIEEAVDHRQAVALLIAQAGANQLAGTAVHRRLAIFDDIGADRRLLDHIGKVALVHLGHAAARMTSSQVTAEQSILLVSRPRLARADFQVGMPAKELPLRRIRPRTRRRGRALRRRRSNRCSSDDRQPTGCGGTRCDRALH